MHWDTDSSPFRAEAKTDRSSSNEKVVDNKVVLETNSMYQQRAVLLAIARLLQLQPKKTNTLLTGLGGQVKTSITQSVNFTIKLYFESPYALEVGALVIKRVSSYSPLASSKKLRLEYLEGLQLADPNFSSNDPVDLLLDAAAYASIIEGPIIKQDTNSPIAVKSSLGWLLSVQISSLHRSKPEQLVSLQVCEEPNLEELLQKFWKIEELPSCKILSEDEQSCEQLFRDNYTRIYSRRFSVALPFKCLTDSLIASRVESFQLARSMFLRLESRFKRNPGLFELYRDFVQEYIALNHMSLADPSTSIWYLPHHGVLRESCSTTKLRVVFNGFVTTKSGTSLNSCLYSGQNLLPTLFDLIMRWRLYRLVFTADAEKMFRQVNLNPPDLPFQAILWKENPLDPLLTYYLMTVTYGLVSSPFLPSRVLKKLATLYHETFPLGAVILRNEVYMDDFIAGAHSVTDEKQKISQLIELTKLGGFTLRKWSGNSREVLSEIPEELRSSNLLKVAENGEATSVLGLNWDPELDCFAFKLAKFFDPLGWIHPVLIKAKILMQELGLLKLSWDDPLPPDLLKGWRDWLNGTKALNEIKIPCWNQFQPKNSRLEIHGFADASKRAYAAVLYLRVVTDNKVSISLEIAKTKVAPLKTLSIPRLELCGAHLLSKMVNHYISTTKILSSQIHLNTDSIDTLCWIRSVPSKWPTFIANRCSDIQTLNPTAVWHHVKTKQNPADIASRGVIPHQLINHSLWFEGAKFLKDREIIFSEISPKNLSMKEIPSEQVVITISSESSEKDTLDVYLAYSSWHKLLVVIGYCLRFIFRLMNRCRFTSSRIKRSSTAGTEVLSTQDSPFLNLSDALGTETNRLRLSELSNARLVLIRIHQKKHFLKEYNVLSKDRSLTESERSFIGRHRMLKKLNPVLADGIIRVGGRISQALIPNEAKHPIILAPNDHLTRLIIDYHHNLMLHRGAQITLTSIRRSYWIVRGRQIVKNSILFPLHLLFCQTADSYDG
ncbi:uncharacterized protein LOC106641558 [Copidosoma floridanum]|uniref:uncharacterized protein LOC106641558 n=1 Tax=Copidosoma floridanum TaxID=29053 RepID=UPI000C6F9141|nr:uncharacterized protein LOC106641558 [Copidosoma floridanum]